MIPLAPSSSSAALRIRPLTEVDVEAIVAYWQSATAADLERMQVDPAKLPAPDALRDALRSICRWPLTATSDYSIWLADERPIGYASLKNIEIAQRAEIHLHMWDASSRGRGWGARLFSSSAMAFYERHGLRRIVCEPAASNPMPNRMLRRAGYPMVGTRAGASSELSRVCLLNTYEIRREIAATLALPVASR